MGLNKNILIRPLKATETGTIRFYTPQTSDETMLVQVAGETVEELFVHHCQTDQLLVVKGSLILVILLNKQYQYIPLTESDPRVVVIPPGIPHSSINPNCDPCLLVNAVIRHAPASERDYQPLKRPFPYDLEQACQKLEKTICSKPPERINIGIG